MAWGQTKGAITDNETRLWRRDQIIALNRVAEAVEDIVKVLAQADKIEELTKRIKAQTDALTRAASDNQPPKGE